MSEEGGDEIAEEGLSVGRFAGKMSVLYGAAGHGLYMEEGGRRNEVRYGKEERKVKLRMRRGTNNEGALAEILSGNRAWVFSYDALPICSSDINCTKDLAMIMQSISERQVVV